MCVCDVGMLLLYGILDRVEMFSTKHTHTDIFTQSMQSVCMCVWQRVLRIPPCRNHELKNSMDTTEHRNGVVSAPPKKKEEQNLHNTL